jgi:hypothetical protein
MRAVSATASGVRHVLGVSLQAILILAIIAALLLALSPVYKPADYLPGTGAAQAGHRYTGTLTATPDRLRAGDTFTVNGYGYDTSLGNVIVSFTGGSWGSPLDAEGNFTIADIPALSGDTLPAGTYEVRAFQKVGKRWVETGDTTVTVLP